MHVNVWEQAKAKFIAEGAGTIFTLVCHHPGAVFTTLGRRQKFWDESYFSVVRGKRDLLIYLNPKRGKRVPMPREAWLWDGVQEHMDLIASTVAAEYGKKSMTAGFLKALQDFVSSGSGSELVFFRNGKTKVK